MFFDEPDAGNLFFQALIAKLLLAVYKMAGLRFGSWLGGQLGKFLGKIARERHIAADNLRQALPHLSEAEQKQVLSDCLTQLGRVVGEFPHMEKIAREAEARAKISAAEHTRGFARWRICDVCLRSFFELGIDDARYSAFGRKTGSLYRRANNPYMEKWIIDQRRAFMPVQILKGSDGARVMIDLLRNKTSLGVLIDQKLGRGDPIDFFGRATKAPSASINWRGVSIFRLSRLLDDAKTGPITFILCSISFLPFMCRKLTICGRISISLCGKFMTCSNKWIVERPEEWFWQHNRWK